MILLSVLIIAIVLLIICNFIALIKDRKETEDMAVIYVTLIVKGKKTLNQVPEIIREEVKELLEVLEIGA